MSSRATILIGYCRRDAGAHACAPWCELRLSLGDESLLYNLDKRGAPTRLPLPQHRNQR